MLLISQTFSRKLFHLTLFNAVFQCLFPLSSSASFCIPLLVLSHRFTFPSLLQVCDIQGNHQDESKVVVSVIFENKCNSFLKSMEFNVLDSLNSKLQRPEGAGPHDSLTVPFQLPPGQNHQSFDLLSGVWATCIR